MSKRKPMFDTDKMANAMFGITEADLERFNTDRVQMKQEGHSKSKARRDKQVAKGVHSLRSMIQPVVQGYVAGGATAEAVSEELESERLAASMVSRPGVSGIVAAKAAAQEQKEAEAASEPSQEEQTSGPESGY